MSRSSKKGPYIDSKLFAKIMKLRATGAVDVVIKTWSRDCAIAPEMVGYTIAVHNGKQFIPVAVKEDMVGHRLGEFSLTRKFTKHGGKMQREIEKGVSATPAPAGKK